MSYLWSYTKRKLKELKHDRTLMSTLNLWIETQDIHTRNTIEDHILKRFNRRIK